MVVYIPVVGNHFTSNKVVSGEYVLLSPEPDNPIDSHAIRVVNMSGVKLGYIPKMQTKLYQKYIGVSGQIFPYKKGFRIKVYE